MPIDWRVDKTIDSDQLLANLEFWFRATREPNGNLKPPRAQMVGLVTDTCPNLNVTDNPWYDSDSKTWGLIKRQHITCLVGGKYASAINRRRRRHHRSGSTNRTGTDEPDLFRARKRTWGVRLGYLPVVAYANNCYLDIQKIKTFEVQYVDLRDESIVPPEALVDWIRGRDAESVRRHQGIENVVEWRDFRLTAIRRFHIFGTRYEVTPVFRKRQPGWHS